MPAALRAIAALSTAGIFPMHPEWSTTASTYAQVWEDSTLSFFSVNVPAAEAKSLITTYVSESNFTGLPQVDSITDSVNFYAISLDGNNDQAQVRVMHTDIAFRLYLLNTTNDAQLTDFLNNTANSILLPFPAGLSTEIGMLVANPAYGDNPVYAANWTRTDYHGTVCWGWPLAMMAVGLQRQLGRCNATNTGITSPAFCGMGSVYDNVLAAYNHLWDLIDQNAAQLGMELWSWMLVNDTFEVEPYGDLSPTGKLT